MSWISRLVTPRVDYFFDKAEDRSKCMSCSAMILKDSLVDNLYVCGLCGFHFPILPSIRMKYLFDAYDILDYEIAKDDPLNFVDTKTYKERLADYRERTQADDVVSIYKANVDNNEAIVLCMNFKFMGGSMGRSMGNAFVAAVEYAKKLSLPLIFFTASGGARMQEGGLSLMQMPRTIVALQDLKEAGLFSLAVYTHPTTGGVLASFAAKADLIIAEPKAYIGFVGRKVTDNVGNIDRSIYPDDYQRAEYYVRHGLIDSIVPRGDMKDYIRRVLNIMHSKRVNC